MRTSSISSLKTRSDPAGPLRPPMSAQCSPVLLILFVALLCFVQISCVRTMGSGLIPLERDEGYGQWEVLNTGFKMIRNSSGQTRWQWQIMARFKPEQSEQGLNPLDIAAAVDGTGVPFTFEKDGQLFESVTTSPLTPGSHEFELTPSKDSLRGFPVLTVHFEAP